MVGMSARKAGDPWFDSGSGHDPFCASVSVCLYSFLHLNSFSKFLIKLQDAVHW